MSNHRFQISDGALADAVAVAAADRGTAQLVIAVGGTVVVDEAHHPDPVDVYAVQKGLVAMLFGMAEARRLLTIDDPVSVVLGTGWTQLPTADESRLTMRTVLNMTTGMDDELRPLGEVGVTWRYNNVAYNYLKTVLETVTGQSMQELSAAWLFDPLGMGATQWVDRHVFRPDGEAITGLRSTAQDLARFGAVVLGGGDGLVPSSHLGLFGRPGSAENPAWGLCWWNNNQTHHRLPRNPSDVVDGPLTPDAPADLIAARGALENCLYLVPSHELVVARTALPPARGERRERFDQPFWQALTGRLA